MTFSIRSYILELYDLRIDFVKAAVMRGMKDCMNQEKRIALLIDAENVTRAYRHTIFNELARHGTTTIRRIYGDFVGSKNINWTNEDFLKYSLSPMQQPSYTSGKNGSDIALVIDAMDILYSGNVEGFCIVSSDSDFTKLAQRLRESGMSVIGMGEKKTPQSLRKACERFVLLDVIEDEKKKKSDKSDSAKDKSENTKNSKSKTVASDHDKASKTADKSKRPAKTAKSAEDENKKELAEDTSDEITKLEKIIEIVKNVILPDLTNDDGWANLSDVGNRLTRLFADFDSRNYGYQKFSQLFKSLPDFSVEPLQGEGNANILMIRIR